jgi:Holliday junction resolvase
MNEHILWNNIRSTLNTLGFATRIENTAATSLPDIMFLTDGTVALIELKIERANIIRFNKYQWAFNVKLLNYLDNDQLLVLVSKDDGLYMYQFFDMLKQSKPHNNMVIVSTKELPVSIKLETYDHWKQWCNALTHGDQSVG